MNLTQSIFNKFVLLTIGLFLGSGVLFSQSSWKDIVRDGDNFYEIQNKAKEYFKKEKEQKTFLKSDVIQENEYDNDEIRYKRWEWYNRNRLNPDGTFPDIYTHYMDYRRDFPTASQKRGVKSQRIGVKTGAWKNVSQVVASGGYNGMGRVYDITFHPFDEDIFYLCTSGGGLWRTTDGGNSYVPLTDDLPVMKVKSVAIDPANPQVLYIAVNEDYYNARSLGIYKSTNGGATWAPTGISSQYLDQGKAIHEIVVSDANSNRVIAATSEGLKVSEDAGITWSRKVFGLFISVKKHPSNPLILYAAIRNNGTSNVIYKSLDGGVSWNVILGSGLPSDRYIEDIQVTSANINHIAISSMKPGLNENGEPEDFRKIYQSFDGGNTFSYVSDMEGVFVLSGVYDDNIYHGFFDIYKSTDNGNTYTQISTWFDQSQWPTVHADQRGVRYHPLNPHLIYWCNDGGLYVYNEFTEVFTEFSNGIICTEFYKMDCSQTNSVLIGGSQDNGGRLRETNGIWKATNGGDAMVCKIDNTDPDVLYSTYITGKLYRSSNGWVTSDEIYPPKPPEAPAGDLRIYGDWVTPYVLDPSNNSTIVIGYQDVYRSTDRGSSWSRISTGLTEGYGNKIHAVAVAPSNSSVIYASRNDTLYRTTNLGVTWVTSVLTEATKITSLEVHPTNSNTLWATSADFVAGKKVFKSIDGGITWTNISLNLPNFPVSDVTYVNGSNNMIIIATDVGPFYKDDSMAEWSRIGDNFPNCTATEVVIQYHTNKVFVSTYGRGIWEADIPVAGNRKPVLSAITPANGSVFLTGSDITVTAQATDDGGVASVSLYLNGVLVRTDVSAPYEWNTNSQNDALLDNMLGGTYQLELVAIDNEGLESDPTIISVEVENQENIKPIVSITSPSARDTFEGLNAISFAALAFDPAGAIASVTFQIDGQDIVDYTSPYEVSWIPPSDGVFFVQAFATDNEGAVSTTDVKVFFIVNGEDIHPECDVPLWSSSTVYSSSGTKVKYQGKLYENQWYSQGNTPGAANGPWLLIDFCEAAPLNCSSASEWNTSAVYFNSGTLVTYQGGLYTNLYYSADDTPGQSAVWVYQGPCASAPAVEPAENKKEKHVLSIEGVTFQLYPNPSYGLFYFTMQDNHLGEKTVVTIVNSLGSIVLKRTYGQKENISDEFDLRDQNEGLYLLKIETLGKKVSDVLQVER